MTGAEEIPRAGPWRWQARARTPTCPHVETINLGTGPIMDVATAYIVTELSDRSAPCKFPGASVDDLERIARRILSDPENHWQRALQENAFRCAALAANN